MGQVAVNIRTIWKQDKSTTQMIEFHGLKF